MAKATLIDVLASRKYMKQTEEVDGFAIDMIKLVHANILETFTLTSMLQNREMGQKFVISC